MMSNNLLVTHALIDV